VARGIAPNTVQATLERLHRKGLAEREKVGRAFHYRPAVSRADWVARTLDAALESVPGGDAELWLAAFVDVAARVGSGSLDELERLVDARRRALRATPAREKEGKGEDT